MNTSLEFTYGQKHLQLYNSPFSTFKDLDKTSFTRITLFSALDSFHHKYYPSPPKISQQGSMVPDIFFGKDRNIEHISSSSSPF